MLTAKLSGDGRKWRRHRWPADHCAVGYSLLPPFLIYHAVVGTGVVGGGGVWGEGSDRFFGASPDIASTGLGQIPQVRARPLSLSAFVFLSLSLSVSVSASSCLLYTSDAADES